MVYSDYQLQPHNTLNVKALARYFTQVRSIDELQHILANTHYRSLPKLILGGGSNILFTTNYPGLVIKNAIPGISLIQENDQYVWLKVGAGETWHHLVLYCLQNGYAGIENLSLIPGTVGAAPIQNIGAYGVEFESVLESLQAIDLFTHDRTSFNKQQCRLGYRDSIFKNEYKNKYMITDVTLKLNKTPYINISYHGIKNVLDKKGITHPTIRDISDAVIHIREQKLPDPKEYPNAGSFFKNPIISFAHFKKLKLQFPHLPQFTQANGDIKIPAAWLIEQCHLKGLRHNNAGVSPNHALIIVNYNNPSGQAILALSRHIQNTVQEKFGISLQTEVNIIE